MDTMVVRLNKQFAEAEQSYRCLTRPSRYERRALRCLIDQGKVFKPYPNVYVRTSWWENLRKQPATRMRCVLLSIAHLHPNIVFHSFSAAIIYGLWVSGSFANNIYAVLPNGGHGDTSGPVRYTRKPKTETKQIKGLTVTSLEQTVLDCLLAAPFPEGLAIADSAARFYGLERASFSAFVASNGRGRHGVAKARMAAKYMDGSSDNGGESIVRGKIIELGFKAPDGLQVEIEDPINRGAAYRTDMYYVLPDGRLVCVEVDGLIKYGKDTAVRVLVDERQRESRLSAAGCQVMRVLFARINEPGYLESLLIAFGIPKAD